MEPTIRNQIDDELDRIGPSELPAVLQSIREKRSTTRRPLTIGALIKKVGGTIPLDELDRMDRAIEEAFEHVELDR